MLDIAFSILHDAAKLMLLFTRAKHYEYVHPVPCRLSANSLGALQWAECCHWYRRAHCDRTDVLLGRNVAVAIAKEICRSAHGNADGPSREDGMLMDIHAHS